MVFTVYRDRKIRHRTAGEQLAASSELAPPDSVCLPVSFKTVDGVFSEKASSRKVCVSSVSNYLSWRAAGPRNKS